MTNNDWNGTMRRMLITGGGGSGKTTALYDRFARLLDDGADPERIALFVQSTRAARAGRVQLAKRLSRSLPALGVLTPHSYARGVIGRRFAGLGFAEPPQVLSAPEQLAEVRELLRNEDPADWPSCAHVLDSAVFARMVASFVVRAQERLLSEDDAVEMAAGSPELEEAARFYGRYVQVQASAGRVDAGGLLLGAVALLQREVTPEYGFDHILVDDYEEATLATEAILAALAPLAKTIVVAADPDGGVFGYRGATRTPLERIAQSLGITETHRLPDAVVAPVEGRLYAHPGEEADAIAHEILRRRVADDVPWSEIAVIVRRHGEYTTALRHALARHGVPAIFAGGTSTSFLSEPSTAPHLDVLRYVAFPDRREDLIESVLCSPCVGLDPSAVRRLRRDARINGRTLIEHVELDGPPALRTALQALEPMVATARADDVFWEARRLLVMPTETDRDLDAVAALGDALNRFCDRRPNAVIAEFLAAADAGEEESEPSLRIEERYPDAVRVLTAHQSFGRSFEVILVAGCVEGSFPAPERPHSPVQIDDLGEPVTAQQRARLHLGTERRLFRLVLSRARRGTVLFASSSPSGASPRTPSRFAKVAWETSPDGEPYSLRGIEAALRARALDPDLSMDERLAARDALGSNIGWWGDQDWTDPGTPLYEDEIRTSYSRLSSLDNCALQYLYQVEMGLDPEQSHQMWLGAVVHEIIDAAQRGQIERNADAVLAELEKRWDASMFPNAATEHRKRLDANEMLVRWINGEKSDVVHSECAFEFPIDGAVVRGKIDAIFRMQNGHLRVVDYKTGRYAPSPQETKENLQLAAYYLAMQRVEELRSLGVTGYLQFSYIGSPSSDGFKAPGFPPQPGFSEKAEQRIIELVSRVRAEQFAPNPGADCKWCSFKSVCPLWPEGADAAR